MIYYRQICGYCMWFSYMMIVIIHVYIYIWIVLQFLITFLSTFEPSLLSLSPKTLFFLGKDIKAPDSLQVNGWQVPLKQRGRDIEVWDGTDSTETRCWLGDSDDLKYLESSVDISGCIVYPIDGDCIIFLEVHPEDGIVTLHTRGIVACQTSEKTGPLCRVLQWTWDVCIYSQESEFRMLHFDHKFTECTTCLDLFLTTCVNHFHPCSWRYSSIASCFTSTFSRRGTPG